MSKFAVEKIEIIVGHIKIYKLFVDGKCQFDEFCAEIKKSGNMNADMVAIFRILQDVSNGAKLPGTKYHSLKNSTTEFEAKKNSLRIYLIKTSIGLIVVLGSKKTEQDTAIGKVKNIHKAYLNSL